MSDQQKDDVWKILERLREKTEAANDETTPDPEIKLTLSEAALAYRLMFDYHTAFTGRPLPADRAALKAGA